ncbi:MAG: hypothetical protein AABW63_01360 [Nanoarchaeota archaeon]
MADNVEYDPVILANLRSELLQIKNQDEKTVFCGSKSYSIKELLDEISRKTEIGLEHYRMHVDYKYATLPKSPKGLSLKEVSFNVRIELAAERLGLEKKFQRH